MKVFTLRTVYLLLYLFIASQGMFYLIGINKALQSISIPAFIEQRKAIDAVIGNPLRFLYLSSMGVALLILVLDHRNLRSITFITVLLSFICIAVDLFLAINKSIPLNDIINNYPANNFSDMNSVRTEWLWLINCRGAIVITGLLILLSGYLIESYQWQITRETTVSRPKPSFTGAAFSNKE
ncbi:hypothetical protein ACFSJU_19360 [Paradesertivirga mongoliensis]|uniref:DUF1772 domain-containing protein n=1 Tax=Paradesertivirga mongoliensis TaxID=2100740 RepID=A0ABW4ZR02_9SPHI|nr:hypothetical protein [Pedobacter mongoliensis]